MCLGNLLCIIRAQLCGKKDDDKKVVYICGKVYPKKFQVIMLEASALLPMFKHLSSCSLSLGLEIEKAKKHGGSRSKRRDKY